MTQTSDRDIRIFEKGTIDCHDVTVVLGDYVDNELPESLRERIDAHIEACPQCQEGEQRYREVIALAKELPAIEVPQDVQSRLRKALNERLGLNLTLE